MATVRDFRPGELPDEILDKQSKMIQREIVFLRKRLEDKQQQIDLLTSEVTESNVRADEYREYSRLLQPETQITFDLGAKWDWHDKIFARLYDGPYGHSGRSLQLQGGRSLLLIPHSSNLIYIANGR